MACPLEKMAKPLWNREIRKGINTPNRVKVWRRVVKLSASIKVQESQSWILMGKPQSTFRKISHSGEMDISQKRSKFWSEEQY